MSRSAFNRFGGGGAGVSSVRVDEIVRVVVLATGYHTLTEILWIVDCIDRLQFRSSVCVETLVLYFSLFHVTMTPSLRSPPFSNPDRRLLQPEFVVQAVPRFGPFPTDSFMDHSHPVALMDPLKLVLDCPCSSRV